MCGEPLVYPSPQPPSTPSRACISRQSTVSSYLRFHLDHLACKPAAVPLRHPVRRVLGFLDVAVQPRWPPRSGSKGLRQRRAASPGPRCTGHHRALRFWRQCARCRFPGGCGTLGRCTSTGHLPALPRSAAQPMAGIGSRWLGTANSSIPATPDELLTRRCARRCCG